MAPYGRNLGGEIIVVEDYVDAHCVRHVHLMANAKFGRNAGHDISCPYGVVTREAGVWHYRAEVIFRGVLDVHGICREGKFRRLVVWNLEGYEHTREAVNHAAIYFHAMFGGDPQFGFMKKLPRGVENGREAYGVMLFEAEWMLERCVAVGGKQ